MNCVNCGTQNDDRASFCQSCGAPTRKTPALSPLMTATHDSSIHAVRHAGFWLRAVAFLIDWIVANIVALVIVVPFAFLIGLAMAGSASNAELENIGAVFGYAVGAIISWLYFTIFESSQWQATPGKKVLGLKVVDPNGHAIGFGRANGRYWAKILSGITLLVGYFMAGFTEKKQALHDLIAETYVVKR